MIFSMVSPFEFDGGMCKCLIGDVCLFMDFISSTWRQDLQACQSKSPNFPVLPTYTKFS